MHSSGRTDTGIKRNNNQDSIFFSDSPVGPLPNLYIVADGMGGHRAGDKASRMAIDITVDFVTNSTIENPVALLKRAMLYVNNEIYKAACADPDLNGMGTTMVAAVAQDGKLFVANVGDSRLYAVGGEIRQITMDHSLVEELIRKGELERKKGRNHPEKNIITKAMGSRDEVMPDFFEIEINAEEKYLLCSDGLSNMVEDDEIRDIMAENNNLEEIAQALIDRANYYGGSDNISVVILSAV
ncbi:MAG: Stp1/IreP family PP2C-type Ser/Thr phosphatase [Wujia sp.]